jgi:hypothetical protein
MLSVMNRGFKRILASNGSSDQMSECARLASLASEDHNGIEHDCQENPAEDQYVMRQTNHDEPRTNMAISLVVEAWGQVPGSAPARSSTIRPSRAACNAGNAAKTPPRKKTMNSNDFFFFVRV